MTDREWLNQVLKTADAEWQYYFVVGDQLITTNRARMHSCPIPEKLREKIKDDTYALCAKENGFVTKEIYLDRHKLMKGGATMKSPPDFKAVLSLEQWQELTMDLWLPPAPCLTEAGAKGQNVEHFSTGTTLDYRYFTEAIGDENIKEWDCHELGRGNSDAGCAPIELMHSPTERIAVLMPIARSAGHKERT